MTSASIFLPRAIYITVLNELDGNKQWLIRVLLHVPCSHPEQSVVSRLLFAPDFMRERREYRDNILTAFAVFEAQVL